MLVSMPWCSRRTESHVKAKLETYAGECSYLLTRSSRSSQKPIVSNPNANDHSYNPCLKGFEDCQKQWMHQNRLRLLSLIQLSINLLELSTSTVSLAYLDHILSRQVRHPRKRHGHNRTLLSCNWNKAYHHYRELISSSTLCIGSSLVEQLKRLVVQLAETLVEASCRWPFAVLGIAHLKLSGSISPETQSVPRRSLSHLRLVQNPEDL